MDEATTYRTRAASERANAQVANLSNVRERCERAAKAWDDMAARAERVSVQRQEREAISAAQRGAPLLASDQTH